MTQVLNKTRIVLCMAIAVLTQSVWAQPDVWRTLLRSMGFADINRARLEFDCRGTPIFMSNPRLKDLCAKRIKIPDRVMEEAALPYLRQHVSERVAREAIVALQDEKQRGLSDKLNKEIASGKQDQLTAADLDLLQKRNESEYGRALSAFASDKEQGRAVARAMMNYEP